MTENRKLYLVEGELNVSARGFWYTTGGEKGPFGYYPHLKDAAGYPIYPDTQLLGDLRMAAEWLVVLEKDKYAGYGDALIQKVFGNQGDPNPGLLRLTDLEMTSEAKKTQGGEKEKSISDIFSVKPRIEIDDFTRTANEHMLVNMELAWLDGCALQAWVFLGYFEKEDELNKAKELILSATGLLSGFGAFRSRGYGRGGVTFKLPEENTRIEGLAAKVPPPATNLYFLTPLVNIRNKPIEPARTQVLDSLDRITSDQLRGWFCRTYQTLFGPWPTPEEMATIIFTELYPSAGSELAYPVPMTTLRYENDDVEDLWDRRPKTEDEGQGKKDDENFFRTKTKPLGPGHFVTNSPEVQIVTVRTEERFRNKLGTSFIPGDDSLIVQELIKRGVRFGGTITFRDPASDFSRNARAVLALRPTIKGAVFESETMPQASSGAALPPDTKPFLVTSPLPFTPDCLHGKGSIMLNVLRRYNTTLNRPRRNRLIMAPGSILRDGDGKAGMFRWWGFRDKLNNTSPPTVSSPLQPAKPKTPKFGPADFPKGVCKDKITSSQLGQLRELLNPLHKEDKFIKELLNGRIAKYKARKSEVGNDLLNLLQSVSNKLESSGLAGMREYISFIVGELQLHRWEKKNSGQVQGASHE